MPENESKIQKIASEMLALAIALFMIGIVLGIGIYIQAQLETGMREANASIPSQFKLASHATSFGTLQTLLITTALIIVVFGVVIPIIRDSVKGGGGL